MKAVLSFLVILVFGVVVGNAQQAAKPDTSKVTVEVSEAKPITISAAEFAKYPRREVRGKDHEGKESVYSGVELREFLKPLGVKFGTELRGKQLSQYILIEAADGYRAVFAIAELDPEFTDDVIILADTQDGKPLSEKDGRFQIIVPADKRHGRWVRQVTRLTIKNSVHADEVSRNSDVEDTVRAQVFEAFLALLFRTDKSLNETELVYLGVDGNKDPSSSLISRLRKSGREIKNVSETGPLRADGSVVENKKRSLTIQISPIKWLSHQSVELGIWESCGNLCGLGCTYLLVMRDGKWIAETPPSCTIS